ncbi:MAG: diacylglycerol kinase family protein [Verrucomicrobiota bacterium]|nr:diacylglycerol kinase family protein [Verrucomicrobiota bacterium]
MTRNPPNISEKGESRTDPVVGQRLAEAGWWSSRVRGFGHAVRGLQVQFHTQPHARIHAAATGLVVLAAWGFGLTPLEWACVVGAIGLVWVAEAINTALEVLVDLVSPGAHPLAGKAKDLGAAAVLTAALAAVAIGALIFSPKLLALCTR